MRLEAFRDAIVQVMRDAEVERLYEHPEFNLACRERVHLATFSRETDPVLFDAFREIARFMSACLVLYLSAAPGGLTYHRLGEVLAATRVGGFGRVRALILYLRAIGYIAPLPAADGREKRFGPTPTLVETFRRRFRRELELAGRLEPVCALAAARFDEPEIFTAFNIALGEGIIGAWLIELDGPTLDVFSSRTGGYTIAAHMMASADDGGLFPPVAPAPISVYALAKAANVSRRQVRLVQEAAAQAGFLVRDGDGPWILTFQLAHQERFLAAVRVLTLAHFSRLALAEAGAAPCPGHAR